MSHLLSFASVRCGWNFCLFVGLGIEGLDPSRAARRRRSRPLWSYRWVLGYAWQPCHSMIASVWRGVWVCGGPFVSLHLGGLWRPGGKSRLRGVWVPFALSVSASRAHAVPMAGQSLGDLLRRVCGPRRRSSGLPQTVPQGLLSSSSRPATDCHGFLPAL